MSSLSETKEGEQSANSQDVLSTGGAIANASDKPPTFAYTHPTANSSAPALSTMFNANGTNAGSNATAPANPLKGLKKNISFAATLSIYDTFSGSVYDRRSEPSTANRLTPALAQKIKEELNSFKMEEMDVHYASRIQSVLVHHIVGLTIDLSPFAALTFSSEHAEAELSESFQVAARSRPPSSYTYHSIKRSATPNQPRTRTIAARGA